MVTAVFTDNDDYARAYGLWQWDYGQQLRIEGLHLPTAVEIHFALQETAASDYPCGTTEGRDNNCHNPGQHAGGQQYSMDGR